MTVHNGTVVPALPFVVTVPIPGTDRVYALRAPTFGEVGQMFARQSGEPMPSDAVFLEAVRDALSAAALGAEAKAAHLAALDAAEDASDALDSLYSVHGHARAEWSDDVRREIAAADSAYRAAQRGRERAEWAVRDTPAVADLRRYRTDANRQEQIDLVALCLTGEHAGATPETVAAMPSGDVLTLYLRAAALMQPGKAEEKN